MLTIFVNDELVYEHDKTTSLSDAQLGFLDKMDSDMARGLKVAGELVSNPDTRQRASFVALNLIKALVQQDPAKIQVSCAYLCSRLPELSAVRARDEEGQVKIELVEL